MTVIYNPNTGIITKIIFKVKIMKIIRKATIGLSPFCQHTFPPGLYCIEWLKLPHLKTLCTTEDELEVANTMKQEE